MNNLDHFNVFNHKSKWLVLLCFFLSSGYTYAQEMNENKIEEVTVVGSHIKGANISDALAVSIITQEDIEFLGVDSGDELLQLIPENGQNFFNDAESISGGINSARGDVGAFNLRNVGTGNTLVLLNGRRLVNSAAFQTEFVGADFVPVNTVNSNAIPVGALSRLEVLRDGASAIYGADAVAGVVNTVISNDFEGLNIRAKANAYNNIPRNDAKLNLEYGKAFNNDRSHIVVYLEHYKRDSVNSQDDSRWSVSDHRDRIPAGSPFAGSTRFRRDSANSQYGQFDVRTRLGSTHSLRAGVGAGPDIVDTAGEFEVYPLGDSRCAYTINEHICGAEDGQGVIRYNLNENRDLVSDLKRNNVFVGFNHTFENEIESYTEMSGYFSDTELIRHPSAPFSSVKLIVGADNYYNPFGPIGSPNRLDASIIGTDVPDAGLDVVIDNYRFTEVPRIVDNSGETLRFVTGLRGEYKNWDWDTGFVWSRSTKEDVTANRVSNTLIQAALNDATAAAYNPFSGGVNTNIEQALVSVRRDSEAELYSFDIKTSNNDLYTLPWNDAPVGALAGFEYRYESFNDDRDPRLDGTVNFVATANGGSTYPFVSDVVNSSPTPDNSGSRNVASFFGELQIPVFTNMDIQLAARHEKFSDVGSATVGKAAFGYSPIAQILLRGSYSQAFRAPNLVTINETMIARAGTIDDQACFFIDPDEDTLDCSYTAQRTAVGSKNLEPEESDNFSIGVVVEPIDDMTFTLDYWSIEKTNTIGLFGRDNHTALDLLRRIQQGNANCANAVFNPAVEREAPTDEQIAAYNAAGLCPAGDVLRINDTYANLDKRILRGFDLGVYYNPSTQFGEFRFKYNASFLTKFDQEEDGLAAEVSKAQIPLDGFGNLIRRDGNQKYKHNMVLSHRLGSVSSAISWYHIGKFYDSRAILADGTRWEVPSFDTYNVNVSYNNKFQGSALRLRFGVNNMLDERAPLTSHYFGYSSDNHQDYGRYYYLSLRVNF